MPCEVIPLKDAGGQVWSRLVLLQGHPQSHCQRLSAFKGEGGRYFLWPVWSVTCPPPQVCCPLCCLWGLSGSWTPAWVEQNSSSSHQVVVWIVVFFLSFSSQKASSRCGLLVNSWSQVVMGELFLSIYTTQCKKLWFWNTLCKDCKKKCPHLSHTKALLEKPFAMCRAERN